MAGAQHARRLKPEVRKQATPQPRLRPAAVALRAVSPHAGGWFRRLGWVSSDEFSLRDCRIRAAVGRRAPQGTTTAACRTSRRAPLPAPSGWSSRAGTAIRLTTCWRGCSAPSTSHPSPSGSCIPTVGGDSITCGPVLAHHNRTPLTPPTTAPQLDELLATLTREQEAEIRGRTPTAYLCQFDAARDESPALMQAYENPAITGAGAPIGRNGHGWGLASPRPRQVVRHSTLWRCSC